MPNAVPEAVGILHYNGFTFPATTTVRPVRTTLIGDDKVTYKGSKYEIEAECLVTAEDTYEAIGPSATTDALITYLRNVFSVNYGNFGFINWGFGRIVLNGPVSIPAYIPPSSTPGLRNAATYAVTHIPLETGPVVDLQECRFIGYNRAVQLVVKFEFIIFDHAESAVWRSDNRKIVEMTLARSWSVSEAGFLTRNTKGSIRFWMVLSQDAGAANVIDQEFDFVCYQVVPPIPGYQRTQQYEIDTDNRGFKFTIVDTPIESPLPFIAPIRHMDMVHRVSSGIEPSQGSFEQWAVSFDFDVEVIAGRAKMECVPILGQIMLERMQNILGAQTDGTKMFLKRLNINHYLTGLTITDYVTKNRFSMSAQWKCIFNLANLITISKILSRPQALVQNNWVLWMQNMLGIQGVSSPRFSLKTFDRPVNVRDGVQYPKTLYDTYNYPTAPEIEGTVLGLESPSGGIGAPYTNYIHFNSNHRIETESYNYSGKRSYGSSVETYVPRQNDGSGGNAPPSSGVPAPSDTTYRVGPTSNTYVCYGSAQRIGAPPAVPVLVSYDGIPLVEVGKSAVEVSQMTIGQGTPVYNVSWFFRYQLPNEIPPGVNPFSRLNLTLSERTINA